MDYSQKKLSIIIPVYNTSAYLERCLNSVVKATDKLQNIVEILVINDGSTDNSADIIQNFCEQYVRFKRYDKPNGGLSDVKNYGLKRATGEYVIFLDSDDYVDEEMYITMLKKAEQENADIVICDIELTYDDADKNIVHSCSVDSRESIFAQVIDMTMMPASWNKIVKRELYNGLQFPVGKNNEDVAVTPILLARAKIISVVHKAFYKYYQREGSIQNSQFNEKRFVIIDTAKLCIDRLEEVEETKVAQIKGSVYLHQILAIAMYPIRRENIRTRYKLLKKYMIRVEEKFPDIWENEEIKEFVHWDTPMVQISRRVSVYLMKKHLYMLLSLFWSICNVVFDSSMYIYKKIKGNNHG